MIDHESLFSRLKTRAAEPFRRVLIIFWKYNSRDVKHLFSRKMTHFWNINWNSNNIDIYSALFTLSLSILILNYRYEGARDVNNIWVTVVRSRDFALYCPNFRWKHANYKIYLHFDFHNLESWLFLNLFSWFDLRLGKSIEVLF